MERLTMRNSDGSVSQPMRTTVEAVFYRLAAYEDTGLEPEEVTAIKHALIGQEIAKITEFEGISIQRLQEISQAEKDGRLEVLPCKVGDTVYHITTCEHFPQILDGTMYGDDGGPGTATGLYCPCELSETCPFDADDFDCNINKKKFAVFEDEVASFYIDDNEMSIALGYSGSVSTLDFGKTVFLTREEAEAALEKREEAGNETDI